MFSFSYFIILQRCRKLHEAAGAEIAERAPQGQRRSQHWRSEVFGGVVTGKLCVATPFKISGNVGNTILA